MNTLENATIRAPSDTDETCAKLTIDDILTPFVFHAIARIGEPYTLSFYIKAETEGEVEAGGKTMAVTTEWTRFVASFVSSSVDVPIYFNTAGTYYMFNCQLEIGNKVSDWRPAAEDTDVTTAKMMAAIELSKSEILSTVSYTYALQTEVDDIQSWRQIATQQITKDGIISTVGNYYAYQSDLSSAETRITAAESKITQNADNISMVVEDGGVISLINQTASSVKIDASKINLNGYVTMTDLSTAGATTISGDNITTGTISADRIDVSELFSRTIDVSGMINIGIGEDVMSLYSGMIKTSGTMHDADGYRYDLETRMGYAYIYQKMTSPTDTSKFTRLYIEHNKISFEGYGNGDGFNGNFFTVKYDIPTSTATINTVGTFTHDGELININPNGLRIAYGNYGFFIRNDGSYTYFMLTDSGNKLGTWNSLRPFAITNSNGHVSIGNGLSVEGGLTTAAILNMGSASKTGTERQIKFQVTSGTYPHYAYLYGGNSNSTTAIGCWDNKNGRGIWSYDDVNNQLVVPPDLYAKAFIVRNNGSLLSTGFIELVGTTPFIDFRYNNSTSDYTSRIIESSSGTLQFIANISGKRGIFYGNYTSTASSRFGSSALEIRENGKVGSAQSDIGYAPSIGFHWSGRIASTLAFHSDGSFRFINQAGTDFSSIFIGALYLGAAPYGQIYTGTSYQLYINPRGSGAVYIGYDNRCVVPPSGDAGVRGNGDNKYTSGHSSYRWKAVYAVNGTIQTSDEREKDFLTDFDLRDFSDFYMSLTPTAFKWKTGTDHKIHLGIGAQTAVARMGERGYDALDYSLIQYDRLEEVSELGLIDRYGMDYQFVNMLTMMQTQKTTREFTTFVTAFKEWKDTVDVDLSLFKDEQDNLKEEVQNLKIELALANQKIAELSAQVA